MHRSIFFVGVMLSSFMLPSQVFASEKKFEISQVPTLLLNKVYVRLTVLKNEEYDTLSIENRGFPDKPNFWVQLNNSKSSVINGFLIDSHHNPELIGEVDKLYTAKE